VQIQEVNISKPEMHYKSIKIDVGKDHLVVDIDTGIPWLDIFAFVTLLGVVAGIFVASIAIHKTLSKDK